MKKEDFKKLTDDEKKDDESPSNDTEETTSIQNVVFKFDGPVDEAKALSTYLKNSELRAGTQMGAADVNKTKKAAANYVEKLDKTIAASQ